MLAWNSNGLKNDDDDDEDDDDDDKGYLLYFPCLSSRIIYQLQLLFDIQHKVLQAKFCPHPCNL